MHIRDATGCPSGIRILVRECEVRWPVRIKRNNFHRPYGVSKSHQLLFFNSKISTHPSHILRTLRNYNCPFVLSFHILRCSYHPTFLVSFALLSAFVILSVFYWIDFVIPFPRHLLTCSLFSSLNYRFLHVFLFAYSLIHQYRPTRLCAWPHLIAHTRSDLQLCYERYGRQDKQQKDR